MPNDELDAPIEALPVATFAMVVIAGAPPPIPLETITCLAGQVTDDVDVAVVTDDGDTAREMLDLFSPSFASRVRVVTSYAQALAQSDAPYVACVGPGELPTGDWIEQFLRAAAIAPGAVLRAQWADRPVRFDRAAPYEVTGPLTLSPRVPFDPLFTPIGPPPPLSTFALPRGPRVFEVGLWPTIAYAALLGGVHDLDAVTTIRLVSPKLEQPDPTAEIRDLLATVPVTLPAGLAPRIAGLVNDR
ncbi:MAG: hypothetical protein WD271_06350 [Acidimicrobiia bacterium]